MSTTATEVQAPVQTSSARVTADAVSTPPASTDDAVAGGEASESAGKEAKSKESKGKKSKDSKSAKNAGGPSGSPSVAAHPRASRAVARTKSWGGLTGFFVAGYLSLPTGTLVEAGLRALVAGSVCYVVAWGGAVFAWRRLIVIELKGREQQLVGDGQLAPTQSESPAAGIELSSARAS
jgi:hypothetical protein